MSKKLKIKAAIMIVAEVICVIGLGIFLMFVQNKVSVAEKRDDLEDIVIQTQSIVENADESKQDIIDAYDEVYSSKATTAAYYANHGRTFRRSDAIMQYLAETLNVTNVTLIDKNGETIATAQPPLANYTYNRFNQLRTVFDDGKASVPMQVDYPDVHEGRRYYAAKIDDNTEIVIENDYSELTDLLEKSTSMNAVLDEIDVGSNGFCFSVSSKSYIIDSFKDNKLEGQNALALGIKAEQLENNSYGWMQIDGQTYYTGVAFIENDSEYIICAIPKSEIQQASLVTIFVVLFVFTIIITLVILYAIFVFGNKSKKTKENEYKYKKIGGFYFNKTIAKKIGTVTVIGIISILIVTFYMQTLFSMSLHTVDNLHQSQQIEKNIELNNDEVEVLTKQYNRRYLNKAKMASTLLTNNPNLRTKSDLAELSKALGVEFIIIFDENGNEVVSDSSYVNFKISDNPKDQSYEFQKMLQGVEYVIQKALPDDISGEYHQYIGYQLKDSEGNFDGFLQISVVPDKFEEALATTELSYILKSVKPGVNGFAFAVNKESGKFDYYPDSKLIGKNSADYGIEERQLKDGYNDFVNIQNKKYYANCIETDDDYVFVAVPEEEMTDNRVPITVATGVGSLICLLFIFLIVTISRKEIDYTEGQELIDEDLSMVDVRTSDGAVKKTKSITSRWSSNSINWKEQTPDQKIGTILKSMVGLFSLIICAAVVFKDAIFDSSSVILYVLNGQWEKGMNIFSITASIMVVCVIATFAIVLSYICKLLAKNIGPRGATVCRLLKDFIKYFSMLGGLFTCLYFFGVDTGTLLASAGILTLVIGLGAQKLIADVLAGLFIIFEGEFRVGDIVTIGDWRGTVVEIGIRTTKIESAGKDVKIFANSAVSGVINMTKGYSLATIYVGIEYGESIERVESILSSEFEHISEQIPAIINGPFYKGITELGDSSINIMITAQCDESDRIQVTRDLNRAIKIIFDKHNINIPFPQVVVNRPQQEHEASPLEQYLARKFVEEQKENSKEIDEAEDDEEN